MAPGWWASKASTKASAGSRRASARLSRSAQSAWSGLGSLRASQRVELDLHKGTVGRFRVDLGQRGLVRRLRLDRLALGDENVALEIGKQAGECVVGLDVECLQRFVVLLFIEHCLREAKAGDRLKLVLGRVIDDPLQLRARAGLVAAVVEHLGVEQRRARRVGRAGKTVDDLRCGLFRLG